jgi:hypothetical protein
MTSPDDMHEWISFEVDDETYQFDVTFLTSPWTCIFGRGCPGVLSEPTPELEQGCCSFGAHFTGKADRKRVLKAAARLEPDEWQFHDVAERKGSPLRKDEHGDWVTRLVDDACIFLNRPDHPNGAGCALHQGAVARGERMLEWKPDVCWQLPLRLEQHVDDNGHTTNILREWKRRDWGEGGFDFHWWCTEDPEAFIGHRPVHEELAEEIAELVGAVPLAMFRAEIRQRPAEQLLAHPALKKRP